MQDEEDPREYRWESGYEKTWEAIQEDESGCIDFSVSEMIMKSKRRRLLDREAGVRLGIMRYICLVLDMSQSMNEQDMKPTRCLCLLKILEQFIPEFHEQNPISQLALIVTQNKVAKRYTDLSNNPVKHLETIKKLRDTPCKGEPSLQNSLEVALSSLQHLPPHSSREIIIVYAALYSCDPGEIQMTVQKIKKANIRISVVGLAAELHICKELASETGGTFSVCLNDVHLKDLISEFLEPPPASIKIDHTLIKVGFPHKVNADANPALCMCHLDDMPLLNTRGYYCPQCTAKYCDLPAECKVCGLMLVTAPHLARSYRHLFPLKLFKEIPVKECISSSCYGCLKSFLQSKGDSIAYMCSACQQVFCLECDVFLHDTMHTCPGCASNPELSQNYGMTTEG